ncbi:MAG: DUF5050 domain-containing protein [Defluviitaleaceae bacterium]|nr:DUF5050 domain-containing protein [Defluviitaleaceae bacterium]MCL2273605.1 DUF5050 domain-containing protein [Defluviitaleaceae bacterium]
MALDIQLEPYMLESVLVRDSYLTHYQASGAGRAQFVATEFYPTYMADRQPNGTLKISERFTKEFEDELNSFRKRANAMNEIKGAILPIEGVLDNNNTAYVVRRQCSFTTVENYMQNQKMEYVEAFQFIRPLLLSLGQAQAQGVVFTFSIKDLRVNPQRELMLDATFSWDLNFNPSIVELARLYFKLITGHTYTKDKPNVADYEVTIPPRLEAILTEALSGAELLYGSIDDFHKKIKYELDLEAGATSSSGSAMSTRVMNIASRVLFVLVAVALVGMVYGGILAYRAGSRWASPQWFADASITPPENDFTKVALTHPRNTGDTIGGSFHFYDVFLFYRSDWGRPVLARRRVAERALQMPGVVTTDEEVLFIDNVLPSFISTWREEDGDSYLFFVDGLSNNAIYRANVYGTSRNLTRISDNTAMHMVIVGDELFYANYDNNNYLYRINLNTMDERLILTMPIHGATTDGERLFLLSGDPDGLFNVFTSHPEAPTRLRHLATNAGQTLFYNRHLEAVFFNTEQGHVRGVTAEGEPTYSWNNINAYHFTFDADWLMFTEPGRLQPRAIHVRLGDQITLDTSYWLTYIWAHDGVLYGIDHASPSRIRMIQLPQV